MHFIKIIMEQKIEGICYFDGLLPPLDPDAIPFFPFFATVPDLPAVVAYKKNKSNKMKFSLLGALM